jgi:hypothetical protein
MKCCHELKRAAASRSWRGQEIKKWILPCTCLFLTAFQSVMLRVWGGAAWSPTVPFADKETEVDKW